LEETVEISVMLRYNKQDGWNILSDKNHRAQRVVLDMIIDCCVTHFSKLKAQELETVNNCSLVRDWS
jgi:hypothetical protein